MYLISKKNFFKVDQRLKIHDSSLVSNENFSEIRWPSGWALGQATWAKWHKNYLLM